MVGIAILSALLFVPRSSEPRDLPVPTVDRREQAWRDRKEEALARLAYASELPFEVRAAGERLRRYGRATAHRDRRGAAEELAELRSIVLTALDQHGDQGLLVLRAVQTQLFLASLRRWEAGGERDADLEELAGDFLGAARNNGWLNGKQLVLTRDERRVMFQVRWARLAGLMERSPFAPTLNEWRSYYRFLIEHPELGRLRKRGGGSVTTLLWGYVDAIEKRDPDYPGVLARGILHYQESEYGAAARAFRAYLDERPAGPRRLWARNYLMAATRKTKESTASHATW
jgi:hypothetical protein